MVRYPIGQQNFAGIRKGGYLYVDKTSYIDRLVSRNKYYFLARPRRFGKSLFLSTLESYFRGEQELFEGLAIDTDSQEWIEHFVIRIDLGAANYHGVKTLETRLNAILTKYEEELQIQVDSFSDFYTRFEKILIVAYQKSELPVVVLVDEYEKPMTDNIDDPEDMETCRRILQGFYSVLKSYDEILKFVFLTGVTKFGKMSVFSGLNNLNDISLDDEYSAICGITEQELISNFKTGIEELASKRKIDFKAALKLLKENYDGYHFSENCPDIYNPFSVINSLSKSTIRPYWASTGTPSLLVKVLLQNKMEVLDFDGVPASARRISEISSELRDPISLFYQTGYLTIKQYDDESELYILGYPNREVEQAFFTYILPFYCTRETHVDSLNDEIKSAVNNGDANKLMQKLQAFSSGISYEIIPEDATEKHFQNMMYIVTSLLVSNNVKVSSECRTSDGRMDLVIETTNFVYIIEIKRNKTPEEALKQIHEKEYDLQFRFGKRKVFLIGVDFSTEMRRISGYVIEEPL